MCDQNLTHSAHTDYSVCSDNRVECHAASGYRVNDYSASCPCKPCKAHRATGATGRATGCTGYTPREVQYDRVLTYWESEGVARYVTGGAGGGGHWEARDLLHGGDWMPFAGQGEERRADRVVFSHVRAADNGGAFCACGLLPENGQANDARGSRDMRELTADAVYLLTGWRGYAVATTLRPASLARLTR